MDSRFLVMFCCEGLECVIDITDEFGNTLFDVIAGRESSHTLQHTITAMMMRARYNPQRHYEIYSVTATEGIEADSIRELFELDPQSGADLIRLRGVKLHSDRQDQNTVKIV